MKTAMQEVIYYLDACLKLDLSPFTLNAYKIVKEIAEEKLALERSQIEKAYNNAMNYPSDDCDGGKYYFMNYITND